MEAIPEESPFSKKLREQDDGLYAGGSMVLWVAAIAVLIGLNFASWSFCMWVFGQPEHPLNYRILTKLDRLEPIHGFMAVTAPRGRFHSAKDLYARVYPFEPDEMRAFNGILKRHYLRNYHERDDVIFLSGEFEVESVQEMKAGDVFKSGLVIRGRSTTFPDAVLDFALPSSETPEAFRLSSGETIQLEQSGMCAALLHVERRQDATMVFTVVPLVTKVPSSFPEEAPSPKTFEFGEEASISLEVPTTIHLAEEKWPISREPGTGHDLEMEDPLPLSADDAEGGESEEGVLKEG